MAKMSSAMLQKMKSVMTKHKLLNGALNALQSRNLKRGLGRRRRIHHRRMGCARMKKHSVRRKRRMGGASPSPSQFLQKAKTFLKRHQVLSRVGQFSVPFVPGPYQPLAQTAVTAVKRAGFGARKRHMRGGMHMSMGRKHGGMAVLPPAVFNLATSSVGVPKF